MKSKIVRTNLKLLKYGHNGLPSFSLTTLSEKLFFGIFSLIISYRPTELLLACHT